MKMKIRLALRLEGEFWNAYLALPDTMKGAKLIGSIVRGPVERDPEMKEVFMALMSKVMTDAIKSTTGEDVQDVEVQEAPQSERSGRA